MLQIKPPGVDIEYEGLPTPSVGDDLLLFKYNVLCQNVNNIIGSNKSLQRNFDLLEGRLEILYQHIRTLERLYKAPPKKARTKRKTK